jgi:hypothetical protein
VLSYVGDLVLFKVNVVLGRHVISRTGSLKVASNAFLRIRVHCGATPNVADRETWGVTILRVNLLL